MADCYLTNLLWWWCFGRYWKCIDTNVFTAEFVFDEVCIASVFYNNLYSIKRYMNEGDLI